MTAAELKYLIALNNLKQENEFVRMTKLALKSGVSKPSMMQAIEKFEMNHILMKDGKNIVFTPEGKEIFDDYMLLVNYIAAHLNNHCNTPLDIAMEDAIHAVCVVSSVSRCGLADFLKCQKNQRMK